MRTDYEQLAGRYDDDRAQWSYPPDAVVGELLAARSPVRVLDLGCGTGRWLVAQRDAFGDGHVVWFGIDPSPAMLAAASAKHVGPLVRARAEELPLPDASIDYLVTNTDALAEAERRVVSQLALLDDDAYARGLARLRNAASVPGATLTTTRSLLRLTARQV